MIFILFLMVSEDAYQRALININNADPYIRAGALDTLAHSFHKDEISGYLINGLNDQMDIVRAEACEGLGELSNRKFSPYLIRMLKDTSSLVIYHAVWALGMLKEKALLDSLNLIKSNELSVKYAIAWAIGEIKEERGTKYLINIYKQIDDKKVRKEVCLALKKIGTKNAGNEAYLLLKKEKSNFYKKLLISSIKDIDKKYKKKLLKLLKKLLKTNDQNLREETALLLARLNDPSSIKILSTMINDPSCNVRMNVVKQIGYLETEDSKNLLIKTLKDSCAEVVVLSILALASKGDTSIYPYIFPFLKTTELRILKAAIYATGIIGNKEGIDYLCNKEFEDVRIRQTQAWALGVAFKRFDNQNIIKTLNTLSNDSEFEVRKAVASSLGFFKDTTSRHILIRLLEDSAWEVIEKALYSILFRKDTLDENIWLRYINDNWRIIRYYAILGGYKKYNQWRELKNEHEPIILNLIAYLKAIENNDLKSSKENLLKDFYLKLYRYKNGTYEKDDFIKEIQTLDKLLLIPTLMDKELLLSIYKKNIYNEIGLEAIRLYYLIK